MIVEEVDAIITQHEIFGEIAIQIVPAGIHKKVIKLEFNPITKKILVYKEDI